MHGRAVSGQVVNGEDLLWPPVMILCDPGNVGKSKISSGLLFSDRRKWKISCLSLTLPTRDVVSVVECS